jgi:hypothetical protein
MWCPQCRTDVSGEASADGTRLACAACGTEIFTHAAEKPGRSPQDLLTRWAREDAIDGLPLPVVAKAERPAARPNASRQPVARTRFSRAWWSRLASLPKIGFALAYGGVAVVGLGALVVLISLALGGSPAGGWVMAVLGHLLVLLGVVTLVTHGLEQSAAETAERLERLGERLHRIEQAQKALAGPHWTAEVRSSGIQPEQTRTG